MAALAVYFFIYPLWRSQFFIEIWFTEGWNAYYQDAAASGGRVYPSANTPIVNNYPPLSFYAMRSGCSGVRSAITSSLAALCH